MISVEYVLADPDFKPTQSVDRSAGYDLKAYIPDFESLVWSKLRHQEVTATFINGKPIDYNRMNDDLLSGYDLERRFIVLEPGQRKLVNAGFKVGLTTDTPGKIATMLVCPRSGLAANGGITAVNSPGIIDEHYPDWVGISLINHSSYLHLFSHGSRIAQAMFVEVDEPIETIVESLTSVGSRTGGFGSTGV
jgi:dUTP pyrophosphatase